MKLYSCFLVCVCLSIRSICADDLTIRTEGDCSDNSRARIDHRYALLVNFSPRETFLNETCSIFLANAWATDIQNGFGLFLPRRIDCSSMINIECLEGSTRRLNQSSPSLVQYTCHTSSSHVEMPCNSIRLTFKRNMNMEKSSHSNHVQVVSLAKEPCLDKDIFFRCQQSYPHSCVNEKLHCNGRSECPNGDDERHCHQSPGSGTSFLGILLMIIAILILICVLSSVLIYFCCRAAARSILRRFTPKTMRETNQSADKSMAQGEDASLMKNLTAATAFDAIPQEKIDQNVVLIDSTKPVYPRLE